jgi:hypothetical protein
VRFDPKKGINESLVLSEREEAPASLLGAGSYAAIFGSKEGTSTALVLTTRGGVEIHITTRLSWTRLGRGELGGGGGGRRRLLSRGR